MITPAVAHREVPLTGLSAADAEEHRTLIYVHSILGTMVFFFIAIGLPTALALNLTWGIAVGGMCSVWAGPGFGLMLASARLAPIEDAQNAH